MKTDVLRYLVAYVLLLVLLGINMGVALLLAPEAALKPYAMVGVAFVMAATSYWFFMHLRLEPPLVRLFAVGAVVWLFFLFFLGMPID
jgi:hypothetical protein